MSFKFVKQLPSPEEIKEMSPVTEEMKKVKETRDRLIQDVITGNSDKFLVIVGPCSADNEEAVCDYTNRLAKVQEKVADRLVLVPRIYTNKPRTTGEGYKGIVHQPDPEKAPDLAEGLIAMAVREKDNFEESFENWIEKFIKYGTLSEVTREIVTEVIDRIVVSRDKSIDIVFKYQSPYPVEKRAV